MSTFAGWTIVNPPQIPATPASPVYAAPSQIDYSFIDLTAGTINPFTGQGQFQTWQAGWMEWDVQMPAMHITAAVQWRAWLMSLQGLTNIFQLGDPSHVTPYGTGAGTPVVNGVGQTGFTLSTTGWTGGGNVLMPGDWIQIGYRLYCNLTAVSGPSPTLSIWPQLRESPTSGTAIVTTNTKGVWRMKEAVRRCSISEMRMSGFHFTIREAI